MRGHDKLRNKRGEANQLGIFWHSLDCEAIRHGRVRNYQKLGRAEPSAVRMAEVIVKLKVMPISPDADLKKLEEFCRLKFAENKAKFHSVSTEEVAFGLRALVFVIFGDENTLNVDVLEAAIKESKDVSTTDVLDVRRAVG